MRTDSDLYAIRPGQALDAAIKGMKNPDDTKQAARMVEALHHHTIEVAVLCVDDHHFHVLARVPDHNPRRWIGIAKKESARALSRANLVSPGGVWAVRFRCLPITNKAHFENAQKYIADHASRGASVWMRPDTNAASPGIAIPGR